MDKGVFKITINGKDKTSVWSDRIESITVVDNSGLDSDTVEIVLDDRDQLIIEPSIDAEMQLWLGTTQNNKPALAWVGLYIIDETETDDKDGTISIHGKAADMINGLKAPRSESYDDITLGNLLTVIADRHDYQPVIPEELADKHYTHIDQRSQSDIDLLTVKAHELGAICKPTGKRLCILLEDASQSIKANDGTGTQLPVLPLNARLEGTFVNARTVGKNKYGAVKAYWQGADDSKKRGVSVGGGDPVYEMSEIYTEHQKAVDAINAKWAHLKRGGKEITIERELDVTYGAERTINLFNHRQTGKYIIKSATHVLGGRFSTTTLTCALPVTKTK